MWWGLRGAVVIGINQRYANGKGSTNWKSGGGGGCSRKERREGGNYRLHDRRYGNTQTPIRARELERAGRGGWASGGWWRWGVGGGVRGGGDGEV